MAETARTEMSQLVAANHYLQLRDEQFERASQEVESKTDTTVQPTVDSVGVARKVAQKACEADQNGKPAKP